MRKILNFLILITYIIGSLIYIQLYSTDEIIHINGEIKTEFKIKNLGNVKNSEEFLTKIKNIATNNKVNITKTDYIPSGDKQKKIVYVSLYDCNSFYNNIYLSNGRYLNSDDFEFNFLSSENTKDSNQIGQISLFNSNIELEIHPLTAAVNENLKCTYYINTNNKDVLKKIQSDISNDLNITVEMNDISNSNSNNTFILLEGLGILFIIICSLILLTFIYHILLRYKEFAIKKLFGFSDKKIIFKIALKEFIRNYIGSSIICYFIICFYLKFYNNFSNFKLIWFKLIIIQFIFSLFLFLFFLTLSLLIKKIKISSMLKNRKPENFMQTLNYVSKVLFSLIIIIVSINLFQSLNIYSNKNTNSDKINTTKNYVEFSFNTSNYYGLETLEGFTEAKNCKSLFELSNNKGGILIDTSNDRKDLNPPQVDGMQKYDPYYNLIFVNNNYLKENNIYDIYGTKVDISNEYATNLTLLVPESDKNNETEILNKLGEFYNWKRYIAEDIYKSSAGEKQITHSKLDIKIVYVKNDQKYFTYDFEFAVKNKNYVIDPMVMIVNNVNFGEDDYLRFLSSGYFFTKVASSNELVLVKEDIEKVGLKDSIFNTPTLYSSIAEKMFLNEQIILAESITLIFSLTILLIVIVFTTLNYLEKNKRLISIYRMHGYSFLKKHINFYLISILFWSIIFAIVGMFFSKDLTILFILILIVMLIEFILTTFLIKIYEVEKQNSVLKGE